MNRETIFAALYARGSGARWTPPVAEMAATFQTKGRKLMDWNQVPAEGMPALFQTQTSQMVTQRRGLPPLVTLHAEWYVYVRTNAQMDSSVTPSQLLNPVLDALDAALAPDATDPTVGNVCTLGGLVSHAWIAGDIATSEGLFGDIEVAIVPIEILVPS